MANTTPNEEVDLGQLFKVIGNGFRNFFNAIGNFIKAIFHYIILAIIFVKKNLIYLAAATILGGVLGYILDLNKKTIYSSDMILKTNYGSAKRLSNQRVFINNLIRNEDSVALAAYFNIPSTAAAQLVGFEMEAHEKAKNLLLDYDFFIERRDTNYVKEFTLSDFTKRVSDNDLRFQKVTLYAFNDTVFKHLSKGVKNGVENEFYQKIKETSVKKLKLKRARLENDLFGIDSLRKNYRDVALIEANYNPGGTSINLSAKNIYRNNNDISLFKSSGEVLNRLEQLKQDEDRSGEIATVVSNFNRGKVLNILKYKKWFRYAILGFVLMNLFLLSKQVNNYLDSYKK